MRIARIRTPLIPFALPTNSRQLAKQTASFETYDTRESAMKRSLCLAIAALLALGLAGCAKALPAAGPAVSAPAESAPSPSSEAVASAAPSSTASPEAPAESAVPCLTEEQLDELCQTGYLFFRHCQIGQEGLLDFDLEDQFVQEDQQYLAVASFDSEEEFLAFCQNYYTDSFIEENILPWFDSPEPTFLEKGDRLYYRTPSGTGIASPLAIQNAVIEPQGNDTIVVTMPLWDPNIEVCLDASVEITLVYDGDAWKISEMQEFWN